MTFDRETIYGIVTEGQYTRAEAEVLQGEKLTAEQKQWWREASIMRKANAEKARERTKNIDTLVSGGPMSDVERQQKHRALKASIDSVLDDARTRINKRRRAKAEKTLLGFVKAYGTDEGSLLEDLPAKSMEPILDEMQTAADDSSVPYHIRIARGHGKTSYAKLCAAWAAATGRRKYIVAVGSNADNARGIVEDVLSFFTDCPKFAQDFPEIAVPLMALNGVYQRSRSQTYRGKPTKIKLGMGIVVLPTIEGAKSSGVILRSCGVDANARGMVKKKQRPDFLILDDLQKDDLAENEDRVIAAAAHIKKTFLGLAGHKKKIAALMTSTPIEPDDLSETFAKDPAWKTTTYQMIRRWPDVWNADDPERNLWAQYRDILRRETTAGNKTPHVPANKFYRAHFDAMNAGAEVLNPKNYDPAVELSGIQHAMNILFRDGEGVFDCEYQMHPRRHSFAFEISAELILSRVRRGTLPLHRPEDTELVVAATDINPSYALTTAIICFAADRTAFVTAYHVTRINIDDSENDTRYHALVYDALAAHAREIATATEGLRIDRWGIDAGGKQIAPVTRFVGNGKAEELSGAKTAVALIGRAWRNWNNHPKHAVREGTNYTVPVKGEQDRRFTLWNADFYKEAMQKSWASEVGAPGGLSIFDGRADHTEFAIQVANEKLKVKKQLIDGYDFKWKTMEPHDYGDCLAMCYALAGADGITGGERVEKRKKRANVVFL